MKKLVFVFLAVTLGFTSIAEASKPSVNETLVDAELQVQYFENTTTAIVPEMIGSENMEVGFNVQRIQISKGGYRIRARVQMCQTVRAKDFKVIIREKSGVNQIFLHSQKVYQACDGPLRHQSVDLEYTEDINYDLPLVQITPYS